MKIVHITDTHLGARSGSSIFREYFRYYYEHVLFDYMEQNCITHILHGGDFCDSRDAIKLTDIDFMVNWFAPQLVKRQLTMDIVLGNHDVAYKNTNKIHSLSMLQAAAPNNIRVIEEPEIKTYGGQQYALIPWINTSNHQATMDFLDAIEKKDETIVMGHFELKNAKMYANSSRCEHGLDPIQFSEFQKVLSGHFHHKSDFQNISYLGSLFYLTWQDYGDWRGFQVYDTETQNFELIENEMNLFVQVPFDKDVFSNMSVDEYKEAFGERFVRLIVTDPDYDRVALMDVQSKINATKPHDFQIQNDTILDIGAETENGRKKLEESASKSTLEYIQAYVNERFPDEQDADKANHLRSILERLYSSAIKLQTVGE